MLRPERIWIRPGWRLIAEVALARLAELGVHEVLDVREKLGMLRITVRPSALLADATRNFLNEVANQSLAICDLCGEAGSLRTGAWRRTRCDIHADVQDPELTFSDNRKTGPTVADICMSLPRPGRTVDLSPDQMTGAQDDIDVPINRDV